LIDVVGNGLPGGFFHFGGRGKIGKALGKIYGAMLQRQPSHLADYGFGELFGFGGEHAAGGLHHGSVGRSHRVPWVALALLPVQIYLRR